MGRDLIDAAAQRAQIAQIEKYNTAVHTFQLKYGYLPGDIPDPTASMFGFQPRGQYAGEGDGNGIIEGIWNNGASDNWGVYQTAGETAMFWVDLSYAGLIDAGLNTASSTVPVSSIIGNVVNSYLPKAKIGQGNYICVQGFTAISPYNGSNAFAIGAVTELDYGNSNSIVKSSALTVLQAYNIDKKVDDGLPQSGKVFAGFTVWGSTWIGASDTSATNGSSTTCYDNNNTAGAVQKYSTGQNNGNGMNCVLSFLFQ
jgi:hypothetical protein